MLINDCAHNWLKFSQMIEKQMIASLTRNILINWVFDKSFIVCVKQLVATESLFCG